MNNLNQFVSFRETSNYLRFELYRENEVYIQDINLNTYIDMNLTFQDNTNSKSTYISDFVSSHCHHAQ